MNSYSKDDLCYKKFDKKNFLSGLLLKNNEMTSTTLI